MPACFVVTSAPRKTSGKAQQTVNTAHQCQKRGTTALAWSRGSGGTPTLRESEIPWETGSGAMDEERTRNGIS